jgi:CIC family chloride channel protein
MTSHPARAPLGGATGDFTTTRRVIPLSLLAILIGLLATGAAWALLALIGLFTNLFFYHRLGTALVSPAASPLGLAVGIVPVIGSLLVGLLARYGSERIRGHGIPEAIEAILIKGSRIQPRLAALKPLSAAISIGSGGPFGAEGPIIMTGGAFGSMVAQAFHLSSAERKTLLVAGAAAGMSATFASPIAAVLLAFELLLFEWKPRSFVPVALASATAAVARRTLLGAGPLFPILHAVAINPKVLLGCVVVGLSAGALAAAMTMSVYAAEDRFSRLRLHWMWWPALGGLVVGLGGIVCPRALGVGYEQIGLLLGGQMATRDILILVAVKWTIWAVALGSGTSGGVLAPLLMIGSALGGLEAGMLPAASPGFWSLISLGAVLGGTMRSPLTGIFFACELTGDFGLLLPVLVATTCAHLFTVLAMKRSILTEKVARRGFHVSREYGIDPLETLFVSDVIVAGAADASLPVAFPDETLSAVVYRMAGASITRLRVVDRADPTRGHGEITLEDLLKARLRHLEEERRREGTLPLNPTRHLHEASRRALSLLRRPLGRRR